jgi:hypothetical protein
MTLACAGRPWQDVLRDFEAIRDEWSAIEASHRKAYSMTSLVSVVFACTAGAGFSFDFRCRCHEGR